MLAMRFYARRLGRLRHFFMVVTCSVFVYYGMDFLSRFLGSGGPFLG